MALYFPLVSKESFNVACIGSFFSPDKSHVVVPGTTELEFKQVRPTEYGTQPFKVKVLSSGFIYAVKTISSEISGDLDTLVILGQVGSAVDGDPAKYVIFFKKYDAKLSEFTDIFSVSLDYDIVQSSKPDYTKIKFSVCSIPGDNYGTVFFSDCSETVYFVNPEANPSVVKFKVKENTSVIPHWLDSDHLAVVVRGVKSTYTSLLELRGSKNSKSGKNTLSIKTIGTLQSDNLRPILYVGPVPLKNKKTHQVIIFYSKFASIYDFSSNKPQEKKSFGYELLPGTTGFTTLITDEKQTVILSSRREVYKYCAEKKELQRLLNLYVDHDVSIENISGNYYKRSKTGETECHIATYKLDKNQALVETILSDPDFKIWNNMKWLAHRFDSFSGKNTYWSHDSLFAGHTNLVVTTSKNDVFRRFPIKIQNGINGIKEIWVVKETEPVHILYSNSSDSGVLKLSRNKNEFILSPSNINGVVKEEKTLAASPLFQITPSKIVALATGKIETIPFEKGAVTASLYGDTVAVADHSSVLIKKGERTFDVVQPKALIIDIACHDSSVVVLTSESVIMYKIDLSSDANSIKIHMEEKLPAIGVSITFIGEDEVYVALSNNTVVSFPSNTTVLTFITPIKKLCSAKNEGFYATEPISGKLTWIPSRSNNEKRSRYTTIPGCFSVIDVPLYDMVLVLTDSGLSGVFWNNKPVPSFDEFLIPKVISFNNVSIKEDRCFWFNNASRTLSYVLLDNFSPVLDTFVNLQFPSLPLKDFEIESQFYLSDNNTIIEVVSFRKQGQDNESSEEDDDGDFWNDDDEDDDDFTVNIHVVVYKLDTSLKKIRKMAESTVSLEGEPLESIVVKFFGQNMFTIFSYSSQSITCTIHDEDPNGLKLEFGNPTDTESYVYDDHWLYSSSSNKVTVVDFYGNIYKVDNDAIKELSYPAAPESASKSSCILSDTEDRVYDVKEVDIHGNIVSYCALVKNQNSNSHKVVSFDFDGSSVSNIKSLHFEEEVALINYNAKAYHMIKNSIECAESIKSLAPKILVGTTDGSIFALFTINDKQLLSSFSTIQAEILQAQKLPRNYLKSHADSSCETISGSVLMQGLEMDAINDYSKHGIEPKDLEKLFNIITN